MQVKSIAEWEHSALLLTFIKLPFVIKIFVLSIFDWLFYTGFTVVWKSFQLAFWDNLVNRSFQLLAYTRGDQEVRGKVLLYHIALIDCNKNSQIETTIYSKLTESKI